jgi:hypothetical protein
MSYSVAAWASSTSGVYILRDDDEFKVGWTSGNVRSRAGSVRSESGRPRVEVVACFDVPFDVEAHIHAILDLHGERTTGEWFSGPIVRRFAAGDPGILVAALAEMARGNQSGAEVSEAARSARTKAALAAKRARGEKTGGDVPYGWRRAGGGRIERDPEEHATVLEMLQLQRLGLGVRKIAARLNERGVTAKRGGKWSHTQVHNTIRNAARFVDSGEADEDTQEIRALVEAAKAAPKRRAPRKSKRALVEPCCFQMVQTELPL